MFLELEKDKYNFFAISLSLLKVKYVDVIRDVTQAFHRIGFPPSKDYLLLMGYDDVDFIFSILPKKSP